jgi:UDP-N-acetylmuramoyl-tripeptide--D-alanyl-D-alanine ligase
MQAGLRIDEIARITGGEVQGDVVDKMVNGISTDTRTITKGALFIALKGKNFDGHNFVKEAFRKGAVAVITERNYRENDSHGIVIRVNDTLKSLGDIAAYWRSKFNINLVAITGSNGKTTTRELTASVLFRRYNLLSTEGNLNNLIGVPLTLFRLTDEYEMAVLEFGTSRFGEIKRLTEIAKPEVGVITNIAPAHLEYFKSLNGVLKEKIQLVRTLRNGLFIYNGDDEFLASAARKIKSPKLTFGFNKNNDVRCVKIISQSGDRTQFRVKTSQFKHDFSINLPGRHNIMNALAAISCGIYFNLEPEEIGKGLINVYPLKGRLQTLKGIDGSVLIDDSYNSNPASVLAGLKEVIQLYRKKRISAVLGDMLELGKGAKKFHITIGKEIARMKIYRLVTVGELAKNIAKGAERAGFPESQIFVTDDKGSAIRWLKRDLNRADVVFIKGSRGMQMEDIVKGLEVK